MPFIFVVLFVVGCSDAPPLPIISTDVGADRSISDTAREDVRAEDGTTTSDAIDPTDVAVDLTNPDDDLYQFVSTFETGLQFSAHAQIEISPFEVFVFGGHGVTEPNRGWAFLAFSGSAVSVNERSNDGNQLDGPRVAPVIIPIEDDRHSIMGGSERTEILVFNPNDRSEPLQNAIEGLHDPIGSFASAVELPNESWLIFPGWRDGNYRLQMFAPDSGVVTGACEFPNGQIVTSSALRGQDSSVLVTSSREGRVDVAYRVSDGKLGDLSCDAEEIPIPGRAFGKWEKVGDRNILVGGLEFANAQTDAAKSSLEFSRGSFERVQTIEDRGIAAAAITPAGEILTCGGQEKNGEPYSASCELFDPVSGEWSRAGRMDQGRKNGSLFVSETHAYYIGGLVGNGTISTEIVVMERFGF